ncbi:hypothetical protein [Kitasatospora purpeofusca]|uniref:hypothetical protein n=1 Tax=Kitasatospora purpeofusca TaxID=67352 RepID=UPI0036888E24
MTTVHPEPLNPQGLEEIRARAEAATPGPWQWYVRPDVREARIQTAGWDIVMDFARWGTQAAQPRFNSGGLLCKLTELDKSAGPHPDMAFLATARQDVALLLAEVDWLAAELATAGARLEGHAEESAWQQSAQTSARIARTAQLRAARLAEEVARLRARVSELSADPVVAPDRKAVAT